MQTIDNPKEIGELCKILREKEGMTLQQVADAVGEKSRQSISNAENATNTNRLGLQKRILQHFGKELKEVYQITDFKH